MSQFLIIYTSLGLGFYLGMCLNNLDTFKNTNCVSIAKGYLLGFVFWPFGLLFKCYDEYLKLKK